VLAATDVIETMCRLTLSMFTSRPRARYDLVMQDSNLYLFGVPLPNRLIEGDSAHVAEIWRPTLRALVGLHHTEQEDRG